MSFPFFPCFFSPPHPIPPYPMPVIGMVFQFWFFFCAFLFLRVKIHRDFANSEYIFDSILPHCFPYILLNIWYYLTLTFNFYLFFAKLNGVKGCLIVLFIYLSIYLAASGLSCSTRDLHCSTWAPRCGAQASLVVAHGLQNVRAQQLRPIVLFLTSLIAREFKYFFTDLLTVQISLI